MNTQLQNYLDLQNKVERIEKLTNSDWDTRYYLEKIIPPLWACLLYTSPSPRDS